MASERPICMSVVVFVKAHARGRGVPDKGAFAPFTGQDWKAFHAFVHLVELYAVGDTRGRTHALTAMAATIQAMQDHTRYLAKLAIPAVLDWSDEEPLWAKIGEEMLRLWKGDAG